MIWGTSRTHLEKGKTMGRMDLGLTVITYDASSKRMDLDGDHQVLHLKVNVFMREGREGGRGGRGGRGERSLSVNW